MVATLTYNDGLVTHEYQYKEPKKEELYINCQCESEVIRLQKYENEDEIYLTVYQYNSLRYSFWERLKFLFGGKNKTTDIILSTKNFKKIQEWTK